MGRITKEEQKRRDELLAKGLKVCGKCGRVLPAEQFSKDKTKKDGLNYKCKKCDRTSTNKYDQEHKEERQQYYQTPQGQLALFNGYAKRHKREELQGAGINKEQWLEMMNFFDWKCAYSGVALSKNNRSIDHIVPLARGGEHEVWNCVPMYANYNFSKRDTDIMEWYTAQDFYSKEKLDKILAWQEYAYNKWSNTKEAQ